MEVNIEVLNRLIPEPWAWTNKTIGGKEGLVYKLSKKQISFLDELLERTSHRTLAEIRTTDLDHREMKLCFYEIKSLLMNGRGAVVITGLKRDRYSEMEMERLFWFFGIHIGDPITQNSSLDRVGHVRFTPLGPKNLHNRKHRSNTEFALHSDLDDVVGLMCLQKAVEGGYSELSNVLAVHNELFEHHREHLAALYEGYYSISMEHPDDITKFKVPILSNVDGHISCVYNREYIHAAAERLKTNIPENLENSLRIFNEISERSDIKVQFMLEPGEIFFWNNYSMLHARSEFRDSERQRRHLLRLWLNVPGGRPVIPYYREKSRAYQEANFEAYSGAMAHM